MRRPSLNLYQAERTRMPLEDVIEKMLRDVRVQIIGRFDSSRLTVSVSFHYPNAKEARRTTAALVERLRDTLAATTNAQVIAAASPAVAPAGTERWGMIARGMIAGLAVGIGCGVLWSIVRNRQRWSLYRLGAFAVAGTVLGITVALLLPDVYLSTAVVQTREPVDQAALARTILNEESLSGIIRREGLYPREVSRSSISEVARRMKQDVQLQVSGMAAPDGSLHTCAISFRDHDRLRAQRVTRDLIAAWLSANIASGGTNVVEVLDPPSDGVAPISPNRFTIAGMGTMAGLLFGLAATRFARTQIWTP